MIDISKKKRDKVVISFIDEPASDDVTGSCVFIKTPKHNILLDCGMHQSNDIKKDYEINNRRYNEFKAKDIDLIFLSHNHGDHTFNTPILYKRGCKGTTIVPTDSTGVLVEMINDCNYINTRNAETLCRQTNKNYANLFDEEDVEVFLNHIQEREIGTKIKLDDEISFKFIPSGHLLNGCQILLYITYDNKTETILYTGDLGNAIIRNPFIEPIEFVEKANIVIGECTYGDKPSLKTGLKERQNDLDKLKSIIDTQVLAMKGRLLIPVFAQSRAQNIAYFIYTLYCNDANFKTKVYIDSPLACRIFDEYSRILKGEDKIEFDKLMNWENLVLVRESEDSKALVQSNESCIVLSSSGMCQNGRVKHHLKSLVGNPNSTILFVGFSTEGSLASLLKDNKRKSITIDFKEYTIRCASYSLKSMSGHMPFGQMIDYYSSITCSRILLHHGSENAKLTFKSSLDKVLAEKCKTTKVTAVNPSTKISL